MSSIPYLLGYAHLLAARRAEAALRPHGLTVRQFGLLAQLDTEPELTMSELARQFGITRQSLHQMVGELEEAGYLARTEGASGRTRRLSLTSRAGRVLARVAGPLREAEAEFLGALSPGEIETLRDLLRRVLAHATDDETWLAGPGEASPRAPGTGR